MAGWLEARTRNLKAPGSRSLSDHRLDLFHGTESPVQILGHALYIPKC